ncbi:iron chelate uptake ABC transporter family permease subunit [Cucumibacter marinus]|uniref:iron chelate uptake ABC transporter family permease subunit n=1 Tax=Cucumibacter marinus TaxID=1121252 RepID=UPI00041371F9|nr:iron chelate uptake ABC transporter family permease subunit [Cucumibacter marinus]
MAETDAQPTIATPRIGAIARHWRLLAGLTLAVIILSVLFMTVGAKGDWSFVLAYRGKKLAALILIGFAIAISTVLFQTVTGNRILTPAIMGFDRLYMLIQTLMVFFIGSTGLAAQSPQVMFLFETAVMMLFGGLLFRFIFTGAVRSLHLVVLIGIVLGVFFQSLTNLMQRMIDPNEFAFLQDRYFASFNTVETDLLAITALILIAVSAIAWRFLHVFDVLSLGREAALNLGLDHKRAVTLVLALVTLLVSVSTALVGPVTFFGLLVANMAYLIAPTYRHAVILPVAALLAMICLVGGQLLLDHVMSLMIGLDFGANLAVIIEFIGGIVFILMLVRGAAR